MERTPQIKNGRIAMWKEISDFSPVQPILMGFQSFELSNFFFPNGAISDPTNKQTVETN